MSNKNKKQKATLLIGMKAWGAFVESENRHQVGISFYFDDGNVLNTALKLHSAEEMAKYLLNVVENIKASELF